MGRLIYNAFYRLLHRGFGLEVECPLNSKYYNEYRNFYNCDNNGCSGTTNCPKWAKDGDGIKIEGGSRIKGIWDALQEYENDKLKMK